MDGVLQVYLVEILLDRYTLSYLLRPTAAEEPESSRCLGLWPHLLQIISRFLPELALLFMYDR